MKKRGLLGHMVLGVLLATPVLARLGESMAECHKRYGRPFSTRTRGNEAVCRYRKGDYDVRIVFAGGRAAEVYYNRTAGVRLSQRELDLFLKVNASTSKWTKVDQLAEWRAANEGKEDDEIRQAELMQDMATFFLWSRDDAKAEASYDREQGILLICDAQRLVEEEEVSKEEVKPEDLDNPLGF